MDHTEPYHARIHHQLPRPRYAQLHVGRQHQKRIPRRHGSLRRRKRHIHPDRRRRHDGRRGSRPCRTTGRRQLRLHRRRRHRRRAGHSRPRHARSRIQSAVQKTAGRHHDLLHDRLRPEPAFLRKTLRPHRHTPRLRILGPAVGRSRRLHGLRRRIQIAHGVPLHARAGRSRTMARHDQVQRRMVPDQRAGTGAGVVQRLDLGRLDPRPDRHFVPLPRIRLESDLRRGGFAGRIVDPSPGSGSTRRDPRNTPGSPTKSATTSSPASPRGTRPSPAAAKVGANCCANGKTTR